MEGQLGGAALPAARGMVHALGGAALLAKSGVALALTSRRRRIASHLMRRKAP